MNFSIEINTTMGVASIRDQMGGVSIFRIIDSEYDWILFFEELQKLFEGEKAIGEK